MARLPDFTALGSRDPNSVRGLPSYDGNDPGAVALGKLGGALQNAGEAASRYARDEQAKAVELQTAQAAALYQTGRIKLANERDEETDPEKLKGYAQRHQEILDSASAGIADPERRERFRLAHVPDVEDQRGRADKQAFGLKRDAALADTFTRLTELQQTAATAKDDGARTAAIAAGQGLIKALEDGNFISAEDSAKRQRAFANGYAVAAFQRVSAEDRAAALVGEPGDRSGIVDRIIGVESGGNPNAQNPNSTATGLGQFTEGTWLATVRRHRPDLMQGRSPEQVLALRRDPGLSREMTGHLVDDNSGALQEAGLPVNPTSVYLSHFLGSGGAAAVLKAAPGTPVSDVLGADQINANRSILGGKTVDTVIGWAGRKMGRASQGGHLVGFMTPEQREAQKDQAEREILREQRESEASRRIQAADTNTLIKDDEQSIMATGKPVADLTTERVAKVFGEERAQAFTANRVQAQRYYDQTHDLDAIPTDEVWNRVEAMRPAPGRPGYAEASEWYDAARKKADETVKLRATDPAAAVDRLPEVREAGRQASLEAPETYASLVRARLTAMDRVGIPQADRVPVTRSEARALWRPIELAVRGGDAREVRDALQATAERAKAAFGEHADDVMATVLREGRASRETSEAAAAVLRRLSRSEAPTRQEARNLDAAEKTDAAQTAVAGIGARRERDPVLDAAGQDWQAGQDASTPVRTFPVPDAGAIGMLRQNPALAGRYDNVYGPGAADKVLKLGR